MQRVERHIFKKDANLDNLCFLSKNLYNSCNYVLRQCYLNKLKNIQEYKELIESFEYKGKTYYTINEYKLTTCLAKINQPDYRNLPAQTAQQIIKKLYKNWKSFFKSLKAYVSKKNSFSGKPKLPGYKHKTKGRFVFPFTSQEVFLKEGFIKFPKSVNIDKLKTKVTNVCEVRIVPNATCFVIEVVYNKEVRNVETIPNTYLGIDIGLNNLATCTNNIGNKPFVINGKPVKSYNQYYNKKKTILHSYVGNKGTSKRLCLLTLKRKNKVSDYLHKASRYIINYCIINKIETIVVGNNKNWKQDISLGKRTNQNFVCIPFDTFIKQLEYKAEEVGIKVIVREESYTSKCSFLDNETIEQHDHYLGKRIKRGLFRSSKGTSINADVNGSYNIIKKESPNAFSNGVEGVGLHPIIVSLK